MLVAAVLGSSMVFLDGSTVNVALPALQASLGATVVDVQWVVNAYTLFLASLLLLGGSLGDRLGRRRVFMAGVALFTAASIACGVAPSTGWLIAGRALQGVGGALLTPGSLALINAAYPVDARGRAIGLWSGFSAITAAAGPVLGGWLIDTLSWRWIFFVNVPLAIGVLAIGALRVPESLGEGRRGRLDPAGALLATLGLGGVVFALLESSSRGLGDLGVWAAGAGGAACLAGFVLVERRVATPMLPPSLFRSRTFAGVNVLTLLIYATLSGLLFFLPMSLIQVHGYSATQAGAATLPFVLLLFGLSRWSGGLRDRVGARLPLVAGALLVAAAFALFALLGVTGRYWTGVFPAVMVLGMGMALVVAPLTTTVMAAAPDALAGTASGVNNAVSRVAGLLAIGVFGVVMVAVFSARLETGLGALPLSEVQRAQVWADRTDLGALAPPESLSEEARRQLVALVDEAFLAGFRVVMWAMAGLGVAGAWVAWATVPQRAVPDEDEG
ncbi:MAG: DHA2 family efflux MFS transporter permease subunit [Trueperaceae bacterium]|nr:DHA2 family efflux MFS transporter permease subunit [Trueperaceae bacterium]